MRLEIGDDADLLTFASKYVEPFKERAKGVNNQKQYCLQLFREYAKVEQLQEKGPYNTLEEARKLSYSCVPISHHNYRASSNDCGTFLLETAASNVALLLQRTRTIAAKHAQTLP